MNEPTDSSHIEFTSDEIALCLRILHQVANAPGPLRRDERFKSLIAKIYKETRRDEQRDERWRKLTEDRAVRASTGMVQIQRDAVPPASVAPAIGTNAADGIISSLIPAIKPPSPGEERAPGRGGLGGEVPSEERTSGKGSGYPLADGGEVRPAPAAAAQTDTVGDGEDSPHHPITPSPHHPEPHHPVTPSPRQPDPHHAEPHPQQPRTLHEPETCYICKTDFREVHFFYHLLCPACAEFNYRMRHLSVDLTGRTALVTGGRVKIGHQTVLRLLRDGARVIVTTRFPNAAARRLHGEPDSGNWADRLQVYGLDLRNIPAVERFAHHLIATEAALDILIHNAAQTVKRPKGFYRELVAQEHAPQRTLAPGARALVRQADTAPLALLAGAGAAQALIPNALDVLPADALEDNEERADSRSINSWLLRLDEVSAPEMLEVQLVNAVAPFLLNSRLKALMMRSPFERRFIVNVSAVEGQFRRHKTVFHPHTNMAKAALNMMTRTSGEDYAKDGIFMNSVDTGWVTDENPTPKRMRNQEERAFFAPLDIVDGMARIYHPIVMGITNSEAPLYGHFLKDYAPCPW